MKACVIVAVVLATAPGAWAQTESPPVSWGAPSNGLRLGVEAVVPNAPDTPVAFDVSFRNDGTNDYVLNLGMMLGAGKVMFPDAVRVTITGASAPASPCELHYFDKRYPIIAGRMDDFTVAMPRGATYTVRIPADRLWCREPLALPIELAPGTYRVSARFVGQGAQTTNLDMRGVPLMNFWIGTVESGASTFEAPLR
jgi:hypothetical protein